MAEKAKKRKKWLVFLIALGIYIIIYVGMSLIGYLLDKYGQAGQMVGFTPILPIMMANLILLLYLLNKILYKPVLTFIEERNNRIQRQIEGAEADRLKAKEFVEQTQQELARIRKESSQMLREARQSAQNERSRIITDAEKERASMLERAEREVQMQVEQARIDLRAEVADLSIQVARQVIGQSLSPDDLRQLAQESLAQMEQQSFN